MSEPASGPGRRSLPVWIGPVVGALGGLSLAGYLRAVDGSPIAQSVLSIGLGVAAWRLLTFMDAVDFGTRDPANAPNPKVTVVLLVASAALFWVPVVGLGLFSYSFYRASWFEREHWIFLPLSLLFLISFVVTLVAAMVVG